MQPASLVRLHLAEELGEERHLRLFDQRELLDLGLVLAVVRRVVMADRHARQVDAAVRPDPQGDHARGIGLQGQVDQVEPLPFAIQRPRVGEVIVGEGLGLRPSAWAWSPRPRSCWRRCSASRIEVSIRSRRWRSAGPSVRPSDRAWSRTPSRMLWPVLIRSTSRATSSGVPSMKSCLKTCGGPLLGRHLHALAIPRQRRRRRATGRGTASRRPGARRLPGRARSCCGCRRTARPRAPRRSAGRPRCGGRPGSRGATCPRTP